MLIPGNSQNKKTSRRKKRGILFCCFTRDAVNNENETQETLLKSNFVPYDLCIRFINGIRQDFFQLCTFGCAFCSVINIWRYGGSVESGGRGSSYRDVAAH